MDAFSVCELLKNSIWHGFHALDRNINGCVPKSRLQVFAASLGNLLNIQSVEKGLPDHRSTPYLKYNEFLFYLQKELFATLPESLTAQQFKEMHLNIDDICWLVCKHKYVDLDNNSHPENYYFKLFRIYCSLADFCDSEEPNCVQIDISEVKLVIELFDKTLGNDIDLTNNIPFPFDSGSFCFQNFLCFISAFYDEKYEKEAISEAVEEVYDVFVENVIKKGHLKKSLSLVGPWWEMWFVLKQHSFSWSLSKVRKDQWGEINLHSTDVKVQNGTGSQFTLTFGSKSMNIYATDCATKFQWMSAFNIALKHCKMLEPLQKCSAIKRRQSRVRKSFKLEEMGSCDKDAVFDDHKKQQLEEVLENETERIRSLQENIPLALQEQKEEIKDLQTDVSVPAENENILLLKEAELDEERQKRVQLESWQNEHQEEISKLINVITKLEKDKEQLSGTLKSKLHLEETLEAEMKRLRDFESREKLLLEQLKEERQAKEDEEIVRDLQSRKLAEEWEKIENMEKEQLQKEAELLEERKKRQELELWQKRREEEIDHLATVVTNLEKEKEQLHGTLKKTKVLLAKPRKEITEVMAPQSLKRSHSADFSFMKHENFSVLSQTGEDC